jgi:hypothetical protein
MNIKERPKCVNYEKCGREAICLIGNHWACGECVKRMQDKIEKFKEEMLIYG